MGMTTEEARDFFKTFFKHLEANSEHIKYVQVIKDLTKCAIEALEKQIPKKPLNEVDIIGDQNDGFLFKNKYCPSCFAKVEKHGKYGLPSSRDKYCSYCGQTLDWGDVE